jgi:Hydrazine synthase alpha subunit middle domain
VRVGAIALLIMALAACALWIKVSAQSPDQLVSVPLAYTSTPRYDAGAWLHGGERFPAGATITIRQNGTSHALVTGFAATADPAVSFDGSRVLFSGKRDPKSRWQVWEVAVAGGAPRRVTTCSADCIRPFYLPGDRLVYARKANSRFVLETAPLAGGTTLQLTNAPANALATDVLRDGRILFEAAYPLGNGPSSEMYTVYSDGSGVESYRCDHGSSRQAGKQVASGDIVFAKEHGLGRFTSAVAHQLDMKSPSGEFAGDVAQTQTGEYLVSWRPDSRSQFSLQLWNSRTGAFQPFVEDEGVSIVQAVLIAARPTPNLHPSGLHDWNYANLLCLNAYTSRYQFAEGSIKAVRLFTRAESGKPELLGSSSVEPDGSFFLKVPADQPLQIEMLDGAGKTLKRQDGWFWLRKGEQRICVGCHTGPERAPENAVPAVLVKSTVPVDLTGSSSQLHKGGR